MVKCCVVSQYVAYRILAIYELARRPICGSCTPHYSYTGPRTSLWTSEHGHIGARVYRTQGSFGKRPHEDASQCADDRVPWLLIVVIVAAYALSCVQ